jgi:flagellar biogenesis protein FliO
VNRRLGAGILVAILLLLMQPAWGQSGAASLKATDDALESAPLSSQTSTSSAGKATSAPVAPGAFDVTRVLLATAGVVGLIFLMRAGMKRIFPSTAAHRPISAVKVLSRSAIAPKQHLLVIQFGKRLVLVGDSGSSLNPLCEITDPDEAANVLAQARSESISVAQRFDSLFGRARKDYDGPEEPAQEESFDSSNEVPRDDPSLQQTQKELAELHDKVRDAARRIGRA